MGNLRHLWTDAFLAHLAETGILTDAAEAAGVDRTNVWRRRQDDPEFARQVDEAIDMAADKLEREARRRALEGVVEPVYQGGLLIGTKTVYSDSLLALLLKGRRKKVFAERIEQTGADGGPMKTQQVVITTGVPGDGIDLADLV
jgi:hypothetical protein